MTTNPVEVKANAEVVLKSCPFCGARPHQGLGKLQHCQLHGDPFQDFHIKCPKGHAETVERTRDRAIAAWNTRSEAAIEGQSYWQARAERFEAALLDISSATPDWLAEHGGAERLVDRALEALADAQQTPKPEEVRDA